jgi:3-dehydrosphinganine reductase
MQYRKQRGRFRNANCYIVGGSSGIGLAIARELRFRGANLLLLARNRERLQRAAAELSTAHEQAGRDGGKGNSGRAGGGTVATMPVDVTDAAQTESVLSAAVQEFGPPDLLVNCAGYARPGTFDSQTIENLEASFRVNVAGTWNATSALLDHLRGRGGTILNVSSVAGLMGIYGLTDYCVTKFGVIGFSEALRQEVAPSSVSVHVLCPPDTQTPGLERENTTKPVETHAVAGAAKVFTPEQVAKAALRGLERGQFLIIPDGMSRFALVVKNVAPRFFFWVLDVIIRRARTATTRMNE